MIVKDFDQSLEIAESYSLPGGAKCPGGPGPDHRDRTPVGAAAGALSLSRHRQPGRTLSGPDR
eukprot:767006-Hanusia_phi.AAC.1